MKIFKKLCFLFRKSLNGSDFEEIDYFVSTRKPRRCEVPGIWVDCRQWWCGLSVEEKKEIIAETIGNRKIEKDFFVNSLKRIYSYGGLAEMHRLEEIRRQKEKEESEALKERIRLTIIALKTLGVPVDKIMAMVVEQFGEMAKHMCERMPFPI